MRVVADFHIHSRYSRATSSQLDLELLSRWALYKGVTLLGTGDATHPLWLAELQQKLAPTSGGLYEHKGIHYLLTAEVNTQFIWQGKTKRVHLVLFLPTIETAQKLNTALSRYGDLTSDGRPTLRLSAQELVKLALNVSPEIFVVPAHVWTPHFALFGANSGFDSVEECFGPLAKEIRCLETGLSSDPAMNWRLSKLDRYTLISNSDSHSASRIGREANVFDCELSYSEILSILKTNDTKRFLFTVEFFPEEGKYHFDGHRNCGIRVSPEEARQTGNRCPACGRKVTIGVMHRVQELADRKSEEIPAGRVPFRRMVPLDQIIAEARGVGVNSKTVEQEYLDLVQRVASEFEILQDLPEEALRKQLPPKIAEGILKVRQEKIEIAPGYDGEYGEVKIFAKGAEPSNERQLTLF